MMSAEIHWVLNVGTEYVKTFMPEEIQWLKQNLAESKGQETKVAAGTSVFIGEPAKIPDGLIESLLNNVKRNTEIKMAYLDGWYSDKYFTSSALKNKKLEYTIAHIEKTVAEELLSDTVIQL